MDNIKTLLYQIKNVLFEPQSLVFIILVTAYVFSRQPLAFFFLFCCYIVFLTVHTHLREDTNHQVILKFSTIILLVSLALGIAITTYNYPRTESWDGLLWYLKHALILKDKLVISALYSAEFPYPIEIFYAYILKFANINTLSLVILLMGYVDILLIYRYIIKNTKDKHITLLSIFVIVGSPIFLYLALVELKTDLFLFFSFLLSINIWNSLKEKLTLTKFVAFALFAGVAVLIKIVILPFYVALLGIEIIRGITQKDYLKIGGMIFVLTTITSIYLIWGTIFSVQIPWLSLSYYSKSNTPTVFLKKDPTIFKKCLTDQKKVDFGQFFSYSHLIGQPFVYYFNREPSEILVGTMVDPGPILYFICFAFIPIYLIKLRKNIPEKSLIDAAAIYLVFYFVYVQQVYWYLLCIFPIIVPPVLAFMKSNTNKFIILSLGLLNLVIVFSSVRSMTSGYKDSSSNIENVEVKPRKSTKVALISDFLSNRKGLIMDATSFPEQAFLTFLPNYDERIVRDSLYFGYTQKVDSEILKELKQNGIKYLIVNYNHRSRIRYQDCTLKHYRNAQEFAKKYGKIIYMAIDPDIKIYELAN